ncbi:MAG: hypothetical protein Q9159_006394 [Coniocarpon cinnabarinum]
MPRVFNVTSTNDTLTFTSAAIPNHRYELLFYPHPIPRRGVLEGWGGHWSTAIVRHFRHHLRGKWGSTYLGDMHQYLGERRASQICDLRLSHDNHRLSAHMYPGATRLELLQEWRTDVPANALLYRLTVSHIARFGTTTSTHYQIQYTDAGLQMTLFQLATAQRDRVANMRRGGPASLACGQWNGSTLEILDTEANSREGVQFILMTLCLAYMYTFPRVAGRPGVRTQEPISRQPGVETFEGSDTDFSLQSGYTMTDHSTSDENSQSQDTSRQVFG